ncbi:hypothetical protein [Streptomyces torulosus]|uniref:DinB/UmuC family translesion DNA polymerase n=1 Tax=Streptomyces torulosus TaxID=68276 RepID=UPI000A6E2E97
MQRLLGGRAGHQAAERARGIDPRAVVPRALPASATTRCTFPRHTLDGADVRTALLTLVVQLGQVLRQRDQAARALRLTLRFAGGASWETVRRLAAPSTHDEDLRVLAYRLMDAAGLQRGRLTGLALKAEDLVDADQVAEQISLDERARHVWPPKPSATASGRSTGPARSARPPPSGTSPDRCPRLEREDRAGANAGAPPGPSCCPGAGPGPTPAPFTNHSPTRHPAVRQSGVRASRVDLQGVLSWTAREPGQIGPGSLP